MSQSSPISATSVSPKGAAVAQTTQSHHPTAEKVALVAGIALAGIAVVGALGLASIGSLGLLPISALVTMVVVGGIGALLCFLKSYWASRTKEDLTFKSYVEKKCPGFTVEQATALAALGKQIIENLENPDLDFYDQEIQKIFPGQVSVKDGKSTEETRRRALLIPVSWFFIERAFNTGQGYEKGTIKFEDPENKIIKFFEPVMYSRASSHYRKISSYVKDRRESSLGWDFLKGLPYIFKHVHMGALPKDFSFIKLEQFGCSLEHGSSWEFFLHGLDWIRSELAHLLGEYDGPNDRKEKLIPPSINKAFSKLCRDNQLIPPKMKAIAEIVEWIQAKAPTQVDAFNDILNQHFPGKYEHRSGSEVLLKMDDLGIEQGECF